ncbi:MAG: methionine-R-sulfoxide reductase [bacterium]
MKELTQEEKWVIIDKGTEAPFVGTYVNNKETGVYVCKQCGAPLYDSKDKFESSCGWPSFDDEISGAIHKSIESRASMDTARHDSAESNVRTEITCAHCGGHLGHIFKGEHFTDKDIRHCVNSISLDFIPGK